jgi:hypothetical protein
MKRFKSLPPALIILSAFALPLLYSLKMSTGVFRADLYCIWITGSVCYAASVGLRSPVNHIGPVFSIAGAQSYFLAAIGKCSGSLSALAILFLVYTLTLLFWNRCADENAVSAVLLLFAWVGIVSYIRIAVRRILFSNTSQENESGFLTAMLVVLIPVFLCQLVAGYIQFLEQGNAGMSVRGYLFNSGSFANFLICTIPFWFARCVGKEPGNKWRILLFILFIAGILLLFLTVARAAIAGISGALIWVWFARRPGRKRSLWVPAVLVVPLLLAAILFRFKEDSASGRLTIYRVTLNIIGDNLVTGTGPGRFATVYNLYQEAYFKNLPALSSEQLSTGSTPEKTGEVLLRQQMLADNTQEAFNVVLQVLAEYGLIGGLLAILITRVFFIRLMTLLQTGVKLKWVVAGSSGCLVAVLISSLFSNPFHVSPVLFLMAIHVGLIVSFFPGQQISAGQIRKLPGINWSRLVMVLFSVLLLLMSCRRFVAEWRWFRALELARYNGFEAADLLYRQVYYELRHNSRFLFNYGAEASIAGKHQLAVHVLEEAAYGCSYSNLFFYLGNSYEALGDFETAEKNYLRCIFTVPSRIVPKYRLVQLYKRWGKTEQAEFWIKQALVFPLKLPSALGEEILKELQGFQEPGKADREQKQKK